MTRSTISRLTAWLRHMLLRLRHGRQIRFLQARGARDTEHSGESLLDHLQATHLLLRRWGASRELTNAALFHSVYGTEFFKDAVAGDADRRRVRELIGEYAESLVWLWHVLVRTSIAPNVDRDRDFRVVSRLDGSEIAIDARQLRDIATLMVADAVEQLPRRNAAAFERQRTFLRPILPLVPAPARAAAIDLLWDGVAPSDADA